MLIRLHYGGQFKTTNGKRVYDGRGLVMIPDVDPIRLNWLLIYNSVFQHCDKSKLNIVWYVKKGHNLTTGMTQMKGNDDMADIIESRDTSNMVDLYVTTIEKMDFPGCTSGTTLRCKNPAQKIAQLQTTSLKVGSSSNICLTKKITPKKSIPIKCPLKYNKRPVVPLRKSPRTLPKNTQTPAYSEPQLQPPSKAERQPPSEPQIQKSRPTKLLPRRACSVAKKVDINVVKDVTTKKSTKKSTKEVDLSGFESFLGKGSVVDKEKEKEKEKGKGSENKVKGVAKGKKKVNSEEKGNDEVTEDEEVNLSSDEENHTDVEFVIGEEDKEEEELFDTIQNLVNNITKTKSKAKKKRCNRGSRKAGNGEQSVFIEDPDEDDDELISLEGSDDDNDDNDDNVEVISKGLKSGDNVIPIYPEFNEEVDFKKDIVLSKGLKFADAPTLRKALRYHSIQNKYDFWYLHKNPDRVSIYCNKKCDCRWEPKVGKIVDCHCEDKDLNVI